MGVLAIILLIASASMWYTARDNDEKYGANVWLDTEAELTDSLEGVEYPDESTDDVPLDIDSELRLIEFNNTFEHTKPGEYSEVIVNASGFKPGEYTVMYLKKAGTNEYVGTGQSLNADANGTISTRFRITQFGDYEVEFAGNTSPVITVN